MAISLTIGSPVGSVQGIPVTAGSFSSTSANVQALNYQINAGPLQTLTAYPALPTARGQWSQQLTANDCPNVGVTYLLTVYAADAGNNLTSASVNFTRTS